MIFKRRKFQIQDLPKIDPSKDPIEIDISYLAHEDHTNAFIEIFSKFIEDNWPLFSKYQRVEFKAETELGKLPEHLKEKSGINFLLEESEQIARELYFSDNNSISILFVGKKGTKEVTVRFDNPYFAFNEI